MRYLSLLLLLLQFYARSQSIVNAYAQITSVTGNSVLAVSNVNQTNHTFTVGGQVIVMQMQDNVIGTNTTNASSFGNLSAISNAGNYEIRTILSRSPAVGTPTTVTLSSTLSNVYNTGSNSRVQLISFRDLGSNFTTTANITGATWTGSVGGVVAISVTNTLTLQHRILADGLGFRGGAANNAATVDFACTNSVYIAANTTSLGAKGEGIYLNTNASWTNGRGKILNGGGGGSQNNAGGGGGGNYTAGGNGGIGWTCSAANSGLGLGGISFSANISSSRIFMGGAGGGGQGNGSSTAGGNGGGIIFIKATRLATSTTCTSSIIISANGNTAANPNGDGAGGGGAGGSIILQVSTYSINASCPLTVRANAGNGGIVNNAGQHGGGGGGGQGVVIYSIAQPTTNVTTQTTNGAAGADNTGGTTTATSGGGTSGTGIIAGVSTPLPIELLRFTAIAESTRVKLEWETVSERNNDYFTVEKSRDGINYSVFGTLAGRGNSGESKIYSLYDHSPAAGLNYYRLLQTDFDGTTYAKSITYAEFSKAIDFVISPNPVFESGKEVIVETIGIPIEKITIYTMQGSKVKEFEGNHLNKLIFSVHDLENSVYLIQVSNGYQTNIKKLVVANSY